MNKLEVKINPKDFLRSYDIWFHKRISDTQMAVGLPMALEAKDFAAGMTFDPLPTMSVQPETLQCLIDELWNIGFRPSKEIGKAGELESAKYHLEDMRKLVFDVLLDKNATNKS